MVPNGWDVESWDILSNEWWVIIFFNQTRVKAAPNYRYGAHKQLKNLGDDKLSDGAKRMGCRELGYFK